MLQLMLSSCKGDKCQIFHFCQSKSQHVFIHCNYASRQSSWQKRSLDCSIQKLQSVHLHNQHLKQLVVGNMRKIIITSPKDSSGKPSTTVPKGSSGGNLQQSLYCDCLFCAFQLSWNIWTLVIMLDHAQIIIIIILQVEIIIYSSMQLIAVIL